MRTLRVMSVVGTAGKHWQIINALGGLIRYFKGTKRQAEAEARRIEASRSTNSGDRRGEV